MSQLDIFSLDRAGRPRPGRRRRHRVGAGRGARRRRGEGRGRGPDARDAARRPSSASGPPGSEGLADRRRRDGRGRLRPDGRRDRSSGSAGSTSSSTPSAAAPARRSTRPRPTRARTGTGSWSSTSGARCCPTQAAVRAMIEAGHGGVVLNISSVRANLGINAGYSAYVAAKGAISSLTRQWATEWAKHGIRVNAIMPTFVDTPQVAMLLEDPAFKAGIVNRIPLGRVGETERPRRAGDLPLLRRRLVRDRPGPRDRRRPHRHPVARGGSTAMPTATLDLERVTPNIYTTTKLRGCNPSFVDDLGRRRRDRHAAAPDARRRDARRGRVARPDPLPHQHRAPRRPHLRQLLVQGRRRSSTTRALYDNFMDPNAALDPFAYALEAIPTDDPEAAPLIPDRDVYYAGPEQGHDRLHRRPDAARRRPHVPLPLDARAHARASSPSTCRRSEPSSPATRSSASARRG